MNHRAHTIEVVKSSYRVAKYHYTGQISGRIVQGTIVTLHANGSKASHVTVTANPRVKKVSYYAKFVGHKQGCGEFKLADGTTFCLGSKSVDHIKETKKYRQDHKVAKTGHAARIASVGGEEDQCSSITAQVGNVVFVLKCLQPNQTVLVTKETSGAKVTLSFTLVQGEEENELEESGIAELAEGNIVALDSESVTVDLTGSNCSIEDESGASATLQCEPTSEVVVLSASEVEELAGDLEDNVLGGFSIGEQVVVEYETEEAHTGNLGYIETPAAYITEANEFLAGLPELEENEEE